MFVLESWLNIWLKVKHSSGVMVSMIASCVVGHEFESRSGMTKNYKNGICCFNAKHVALRSKDGLARNQNNVSEWSDMSTNGLLFQWAIKSQHSMLL